MVRYCEMELVGRVSGERARQGIKSLIACLAKKGRARSQPVRMAVIYLDSRAVLNPTLLGQSALSILVTGLVSID